MSSSGILVALSGGYFKKVAWPLRGEGVGVNDRATKKKELFLKLIFAKEVPLATKLEGPLKKIICFCGFPLKTLLRPILKS